MKLGITLAAIITIVIGVKYGWIAAIGFWAAIITVLLMAAMVFVAWIARIDAREP